MNKIALQILKGTRDFLPAQFILRKKVIEIIARTFENFGFEPMDTPALEYAETLEGKYGEEGDRLIYKFEDRGGRKVALRYDLTVPLARTMAMYQVERPFRRYQIAPVWRADKPQKGRFREFWQCDADIVGSKEVWADAEVLAVTYSVLKNLGFNEFTIRINNRKLLNGMALYGGVTDKEMAGFFRIIDKAEKVGWDQVKEELASKNFPEKAIKKTIALIVEDTQGDTALRRLKTMLTGIPSAQEGIAELEEIQRCLANLGVEERNVWFDGSLARGLDYYTGPIFETIIENPRIGSISGGGRFDSLIGMFSGKDVPATGTSLGLERIITVMEELAMLPTTPTVSQVLVTMFERSLFGESLTIASELRSAGIKTGIYLNDDKLKKQLDYANKKGIPLVIIIGPDEKGKGEVVLKDMEQKTQVTVLRQELVNKIKAMLRLASP
ncbi:MAG TPA: histidine--tRNA ligase [Thermodesulfobacteriota bacterium]|nr:histidine--tRNA ligase [Thermodesulfobacteriota bacterium]